MTQHPLPPTWSGWSIISANQIPAFTLWCTGLPGTGKTTLAQLVKQALVARGYNVEIIDRYRLMSWLYQELHIEEDIADDYGHTPGYDAFISYICLLLTRNGVITITTGVSPYSVARNYAREQLQNFIEVYLTCNTVERYLRVTRLEHLPRMSEDFYQPPQHAELHIQTDRESAERSALRVIDYLEQHGYIVPRWEESGEEASDEEIETIKARLRALGYLE